MAKTWEWSLGGKSSPQQPARKGGLLPPRTVWAWKKTPRLRMKIQLSQQCECVALSREHSWVIPRLLNYRTTNWQMGIVLSHYICGSLLHSNRKLVSVPNPLLNSKYLKTKALYTSVYLLGTFGNKCPRLTLWGHKKYFPPVFLVLLTGLIISLIWDRLTRENVQNVLQRYLWMCHKIMRPKEPLGSWGLCAILCKGERGRGLEF